MNLERAEFLDQLPFSVCICDASGAVRFRNAAAVTMFGEVAVGGGEPCFGAARLFRSDGIPLPAAEHPAVAALARGAASRRLDVLVERPGGERVEAVAAAMPSLGDDGCPEGAVCVLVELATLPPGRPPARHLAAIVEGTEDAILSLAPDLTISAWNQGAARLFGYQPTEAVGRPFEMLVPAERQRAEAEALRRVLDRGTSERFEAERLRSDGTRIHVAVTSSPMAGRGGETVAVSQIARDVTESRRSMERQDLVIAEMNHRVKNLLILAGSIVGLAARTAASPQALARDVAQRLAALARAHELTLPRNRYDGTSAESPVSLHALIESVLSPHDRRSDGSSRIRITGDDTRVAGGMPLTGLALLLHEFATNAAKHGSLAHEAGTVGVQAAVADAHLVLTWTEEGGPPPGDPAQGDGFGTRLVDLAARQLEAELSREWRHEGLRIRLSIDLSRLSAPH